MHTLTEFKLYRIEIENPGVLPNAFIIRTLAPYDPADFNLGLPNNHVPIAPFYVNNNQLTVRDAVNHYRVLARPQDVINNQLQKGRHVIMEYTELVSGQQVAKWNIAETAEAIPVGDIPFI